MEQVEVSVLGLSAWMSSPSASTSQCAPSWPVLTAWRSVTSRSLASQGLAGQTVASRLCVHKAHCRQVAWPYKWPYKWPYSGPRTPG